MPSERSELPMEYPKPMYRHGDVGFFLVRDRTTPHGKPRANKVLALGEVTGHAHVVIEGTVCCDEQGNLEVVAGENTRIRHLQLAPGEGVLEMPTIDMPQTGEHAEIKLAPGVYKIAHPETYTPTEWLRSRD
jgi:hypothetical protein